MLFTFLLVVQFVIAASLVAVILVQKSEGGGLTSGGSPSGLMSARGAADFLTRLTAILATAFIGMSILLAVMAANHHSSAIDASQVKAPAAAVPPPAAAPAPAAVPAGNTSAAAGNSTTAVGNSAATSQGFGNSTVPFAQ